jgi:pimeloyl-ACP methyl ester carboxylesterase
VPLGVDAHAAHVTLLLDSLGVPDAVVAGQGVGVAVAARLARHEPRVRRLALLAPARPDRGVAADLAASTVPMLVVPGAARPATSAVLGGAVLDFLGR